MKNFTGTVTSTNMTHTASVEVTRRWLHPIYKKTVKRTKNYLVHDANQVAGVGDVVTFKPCRPISKRKHFMLVEVTLKAPVSLAAEIKKETAKPATAKTPVKKAATAKKALAKAATKKAASKKVKKA